MCYDVGELMRYSQLAKFKEIGEKGQQILETKTVTIVGLGNLGSTVSAMLLRSGIGMRLIDRGRCEVEDLSGQSLYVEDDHTKFKAKQAKKKLEELNPKVKVKTFHEDLNKHNIYLIEGDVIVDLGGDFETSKLISDHCKKKKLPLIYAIASGSQGLIVTSDKGVPFEKLKVYTSKMKQISENGMITSTVHYSAAIIVKNILKILLKKPYQKEALFFDIWTDAVKKQKV